MSKIVNVDNDRLYIVRDSKNITYYNKSDLSVFGQNGLLQIKSNGTLVERLKPEDITSPRLDNLDEYVLLVQSYIEEYTPPPFDSTVRIYSDQKGDPGTLVYLTLGSGLSVVGGELRSSGGSAVWGGITGTLSLQTDLQTALNAKQATLVSGTNIKTINGSSVLGSGNIDIYANYDGGNPSSVPVIGATINGGTI